jgi:hypothetical protein
MAGGSGASLEIGARREIETRLGSSQNLAYYRIAVGREREYDDNKATTDFMVCRQCNIGKK